jgi:hypothetical protein
MAFPIIGGSQSGGYLIDNSLRFNDGDSPRLDRTSVSSPTDSKIFTYSVWLKKTSIGSNFTILDARSGTNRSQILFRSGSSEAIRIVETSNNFSSFDTLITTNALYRDVSAWYHVLIKYDSTNGTANNRFLIYVNGVEQSLDINTSVTLNYTTPLNEGNYTNDLGHADGAEPFDGYIAEAHFIDGQALSPTDFGEFDEDSGIWKPISYSGSYGTNGFYLDFENSGSLGADQSGNGNNFTPTNLASTDQTTDTPTNNFCYFKSFRSGSSNQGAPSEGNLQANSSGELSTFEIPKAGKWYWEVDVRNANGYTGIGFTNYTYTQYLRWNVNYGNWNNASAGTLNAGSQTAQTNCVVMLAFDYDNQKFWMGVNGTWFDSGNPSAGTNSTLDLATSTTGYWFTEHNLFNGGTMVYNYGQDSSFAGSKTRQNNTDQNGYGDFYYAPPSGYLALCTQNLATELSPTIDDGSAYFQATTYTGDGNDDRQVTNSGNSDLQPDWIWVKNRSDAFNHILQDTSRGLTTGGYLASNQTQAESGAITVLIKTATSNGFTVGTSGAVNANTNNLVAWQWKANAGSTSSNTDGTKTTTVQASTTSGFSIVTYDGLTDGQTIGHGLGGTPEMIIFKRRDAVGSWHTWHQGLGDGNNYLILNTTGAKSNDAYEYISNIGSSTVQLQGSSSFKEDTVGYFFRGIEGYSKFGSYTGNGSTDGTFVYTGFRPAWVMVKRTDNVDDWQINDATRDSFNLVGKKLIANSSDAEVDNSNNSFDFLSNGFKARGSEAQTNASGGTYIYMAFAENPFVSSGAVPVTAR